MPRTIGVLFALALLFLPVHFLFTVRSANLTSVKVTLSTPRLSFSGKLASGNTVGSSIVNLQTTAGAAPSTTSANLFEGDNILIGESLYRVASPSSGGSFSITNHSTTPGSNVLQSTDADENDLVVASRSASLTVNFTTVSAISGGKFRILVPAATANSNDALPDQTGWDFGGGDNSTVTVTCPDDLSSGGDSYDFAAGTAEAAGLVRDGRTYHVFTCTYTGAGGNGTTFDTTGKQFVISNLINPAPSSTHSEGYADTYRVVVEHLTGADVLVDQTEAAVAVLESVRVTATVAPQITFRILGVAASTSVCGQTTSVATSPILVPFGELFIDTFKYAAQQLVVSTNADNGYTVTAIEDDQLRRFNATCLNDAVSGSCIPDAAGDNGAMAPNAIDKWASTAVKGFGYTLQNNTAATVPFEYSTTTGNCSGAGGNCYRHFADAEDTSPAQETPQEIFSSTTVADNQNLYVCYKAIISSTQEAGSDYATAVTYRATASF